MQRWLNVGSTLSVSPVAHNHFTTLDHCSCNVEKSFPDIEFQLERIVQMSTTNQRWFRVVETLQNCCGNRNLCIYISNDAPTCVKRCVNVVSTLHLNVNPANGNSTLWQQWTNDYATLESRCSFVRFHKGQTQQNLQERLHAFKLFQKKKKKKVWHVGSEPGSNMKPSRRKPWQDESLPTHLKAFKSVQHWANIENIKFLCALPEITFLKGWDNDIPTLQQQIYNVASVFFKRCTNIVYLN